MNLRRESPRGLCVWGWSLLEEGQLIGVALEVSSSFLRLCNELLQTWWLNSTTLWF